MVKFIKKYLRNVKINKGILFSSLKASAGAIIKIFLLHKLQQIKYYKPIMFILKIILKWSTISTLLSIAYTIICKIWGVSYDLTFFISILSGIWIIITEISLDSIYQIWDSIINIYNKLLAKIVVKLSESKNKTSDTEERIKRIEEMFARLPQEKRLINHDELVEYYVEQEKMKDPNYNKPKIENKNENLVPLSYHDIFKIVALVGSTIGLLVTATQYVEQLKALLNTINGIREVFRGFTDIGGFVTNLFPDSIRNVFGSLGRLWSSSNNAESTPVTDNSKSWWSSITNWFTTSKNESITPSVTTSTTVPSKNISNNWW